MCQHGFFVVVVSHSRMAAGGGFSQCRRHDYLFITSRLTIWVALAWPSCGHDFPLSYIVISDLGHTVELCPEIANQDLIRGSRATSTSDVTRRSIFQCLLELVMKLLVMFFGRL